MADAYISAEEPSSRRGFRPVPVRHRPQCVVGRWRLRLLTARLLRAGRRRA